MLGSNDEGIMSPVISFLNSSKVYPIANLAAIFAIGKPVAFDASAEAVSYTHLRAHET